MSPTSFPWSAGRKRRSAILQHRGTPEVSLKMSTSRAASRPSGRTSAALAGLQTCSRDQLAADVCRLGALALVRPLGLDAARLVDIFSDTSGGPAC